MYIDSLPLMEEKNSQEHVVLTNNSQGKGWIGTGLSTYTYRQKLHSQIHSQRVTKIQANHILIKPASRHVNNEELTVPHRANILHNDLTLLLGNPPQSVTDPLRVVLTENSISSKSIPASYIVGLPTIVTTAPKQLQGTFKKTVVSLTDQNTKYREKLGAMQTYLERNEFGSNLRGFVTKNEYNICAQECHYWESKYNDLFSTFQDLQRQRIQSKNSNSISHLKEQNWVLQQRIKKYQESERQIYHAIEFSVDNLTSKYRQLAIKESKLLFDKFRLDCDVCEK